MYCNVKIEIKNYIIEINCMSYISLGGNCAVTYQLSSKGYYQRHPFDWSKISVFQLNSVLENDFKDYDDLLIKKLSSNHLCNNRIPSYILQNKYKITFAHELINKYDLKTFQDKIKSRIIKFKNMKNPTFIRLETRNISDSYFKEQYNKLIDNLSKYFSEFHLIVISKNLTFDNPKITFIKLEEFSEDWRYLEVDWSFIKS